MTVLHKSFLLSFLIVLCICYGASSENVGSDIHLHGEWDASLLVELRSMYEKDQQIRERAINESQQSGQMLLSNELRDLWAEIDRQNLFRLKEIVQQYGWPGVHLIGEEGAHIAWLLVQHCDWDIEFQKLCLGLLRQAVAKDDAARSDFAYLTDRILVNDGKEQIYGTQIQLIDGKAVPFPIQDPLDLEKRRKEMDLMPFSEYLDLLKTAYHLQ